MNAAPLPLDPANLTPAASLNRQRLVDLPGVELEPDAKGQLFFDLLGSHAITALMRDAGMSEDELRQGTDAVNDRFVSRDAAVRTSAADLAARLGRRLAYLTLVLRRGDAANRAARPDWDDSYWSHWAGIRDIWFGGGIMGGALGKSTVREASAALREAGMDDVTLHQAEHAAQLPLIGAARGAPAAAELALVFDFGGTAVKRGFANYEKGELVRLDQFPSLPSGSDELEKLSERARLPLLAKMVVGVITDYWKLARSFHFLPSRTILISLASYLCGSQPLPRQGGLYSELSQLSDNFGDWLAETLSEALDTQINVKLSHDGTSAARTYAGHSNSAAILLGTALGVGFPGSAAGLRPVAQDLRLYRYSNRQSLQEARHAADDR